MSRFIAAFLLFAFACSGAAAHTQSYGYLTITEKNGGLSGLLELAATDANTMLNLDHDGDGKLTWGEVRLREQVIISALLSQVSIGLEAATCSLKGQSMQTSKHGGEFYLAIPFDAHRAKSGKLLEIGYSLMFKSDAQHRGLISVETQQLTQNFVMTPGSPRISVTLDAGSFELFLSFVKHGFHHIMIGYDHILFVITLLLGTIVLRRQAHDTSLRPLLLEAVRVATAFTLAHSLTLSLAALQILRIPPVVTESLIAVTIALAAANNLWPVVTRRLWVVAFIFGLVHGVGFANVLADLDLPKGNLVLALLAFNGGVELGQLAIIAVGLPLLYALSMQTTVGRVALPASSFAIVAIGIAWAADRALSLKFMPF